MNKDWHDARGVRKFNGKGESRKMNLKAQQGRILSFAVIRFRQFIVYHVVRTSIWLMFSGVFHDLVSKSRTTEDNKHERKYKRSAGYESGEQACV